jgi:hypothetical protein
MKGRYLMTRKSNSITVQKARATAAIAGIQKYYSATAAMVMAGVSYTPTELITLLQAYVSALTALEAMRAQLHDAVLAGSAGRKQINTILLALQGFVTNAFGSSSSKLGDFGFTPRKQGQVKVATKAEAQIKSKATRQARRPAGPAAPVNTVGASNGSLPTAVTQTAASPGAPKV